jgi:hypothetical protein
LLHQNPTIPSITKPKKKKTTTNKMKLYLTVGLISGASAFTAPHAARLVAPKSSGFSTALGSTAEDVKTVAAVFDQEQFIAASKEMRLKHLEEQAMYALKIAVENYGNAVFPNAMIAGYVLATCNRRRPATILLVLVTTSTSCYYSFHLTQHLFFVFVFFGVHTHTHTHTTL